MVPNGQLAPSHSFHVYLLLAFKIRSHLQKLLVSSSSLPFPAQSSGGPRHAAALSRLDVRLVLLLGA